MRSSVGVPFGYIALLVSLTVPVAASAQAPTRASNAVYAEAAGNALFLGSVNYERSLNDALAARLGLSPFGAAVAMVNVLPSLGGNHWGEVGVGLLMGADEDGFMTGTLGYRYQKAGQSVLFRASLTPLITSAGVTMWMGVSLGFAW